MLTLCACSTDQPDTSSFEAMDTLMTLSVYGGGRDILDKLQKQIERLDSLMDATDGESEIFMLNRDKRRNSRPAEPIHRACEKNGRPL